MSTASTVPEVPSTTKDMDDKFSVRGLHRCTRMNGVVDDCEDEGDDVGDPADDDEEVHLPPSKMLQVSINIIQLILIILCFCYCIQS